MISRARLAAGLRFWRLHGTRTLLWELMRRHMERTERQARIAATAPAPPAPGELPEAASIVRARFTALEPLPLYPATAGGRPRVTMVTDSINAGSLFGGVGTAMILAGLLAQARQARLRIVTRTERARPDNLDAVLSLYGITLPGDVEFAFLPPGTRHPADAFADELFLTTSWWTTASALGALPPEQILYLLQEDERMFYPLGDEHLRCSRLLADTRLRLAINTGLLCEHLAASGVPGLEQRAVAFEPAFPRSLYHPPAEAAEPAEAAAGRRRKLLFYARPNHARNLFLFGLEVLDQAVARGVIDLQRWDIVLVGAHVPPLSLAGGCVPERRENLSWQDYAALVRQADLGFSLMYTPHPSYPPLDLAASGAVVVTNRFGAKTSLARYSENILCADLDPAAMLAALAEGLRLAEDTAERRRRFARQQLATDWAAALEPVVRRFG